MKIVSATTAVAGLAIGAWLINHYGVAAVGHSVGAIGWSGFAFICLYHLGLFCLLGSAWHAINPPPRPASAWAFIWGRLIRDSGAEVLPLSQLGGFVMGARAVTLMGIPAATAVGTTVVDVTVELVAQLVCTVLGLGLLVWLIPTTDLVRPVALGLVVASVVTVVFVLFQRRGMSLLERLARRSAAHCFPEVAAGIQKVGDVIHAAYRNRAGLWRGFQFQFAAWIVGAIEIFIALRLMGVAISPFAVMVIESLLYAIRNVAFMVPDAIGVQESTYIVLGGMFGLEPQMALAVSLLKRARDISIGVPCLLVWQAIESKRLLTLTPRVTRWLRALPATPDSDAR